MNIINKSEKEIWEKMKEIRELHSLSRREFAENIGTSENTATSIEKRGKNPRTELVQNVCKRWPEYTFWLLLDVIYPEIGQIFPRIKWEFELEGARIKNNKGKETDKSYEYSNPNFIFDLNNNEHIEDAIKFAKKYNYKRYKEDK